MAEKEKKEEEKQNNSVSFEPQKHIRPELSEEELLEFEEDLREFIALRAACKPLQPNAVQTFRRPGSLQENLHYLYLRLVKSDIERYESKYCPKSVSETNSRASSVSVKSDSSKYEPPSFNPQKKQSQLTEEISSCSVCEEAVKDPVRLLCGHWSCKQCVLSFWEQKGSTADYSCKKCGRRSETDQDLQSVLLQKKIKRVEMEMERLQAEKEKLQAEKETLRAEKEKFQAEKEKLQPEKEKLQAEKEKLQAEKEKIELEKRKLTLEIQFLEQRGSYTNYDQGVVIPKTRIPYI